MLARLDVSAALAPASADANGRAKIMTILERLAAHYPAQSRSDAAERYRWADWLDDLADKPLDLILEASTAWRRSPSAWFPTPGQLLAIVQPALSMRRALAHSIDRHLAKPDHVPVELELVLEELTAEERAEAVQILRRPFARGSWGSA
jgi:hypothetical protein